MKSSIAIIFTVIQNRKLRATGGVETRKKCPDHQCILQLLKKAFNPNIHNPVLRKSRYQTET